MKKALLIVAIMLSACSRDVILLKNFETGQIARCEETDSGQYSFMRNGSAKDCAKDFMDQGFKQIERSK